MSTTDFPERPEMQKLSAKGGTLPCLGTPYRVSCPAFASRKVGQCARHGVPHVEQGAAAGEFVTFG